MSTTDTIRAVAKEIHRLRDPHNTEHDGEPYLHEAEVFCASAEAFAEAKRNEPAPAPAPAEPVSSVQPVEEAVTG